MLDEESNFALKIAAKLLEIKTSTYLTVSSPGLPWIWISMDISMDISMCGYQTLAILWICPWIFICCRTS